MSGTWSKAPLAALGWLVGCGWFGGEEAPPPREIHGLSDLEGTRLGDPPAPMATFGFDPGSSSVGPFGTAPGLVLQRAFPGEGVGDPLQVVAVFDRPMVPLGDLDSMAGSVPVTCSPGAGLKPRWAGTTTAVLVAPREGLPASTRFTCSVPAATSSLSGERLGRKVEWSFETPRLSFELLSPSAGQEGVDPAAPVEVRFSQEVTPDRARELLVVTQAGQVLPVAVRPSDRDPTALVLEGAFVPHAAVEVTLPAGAVGPEGPLPTTSPQTAAWHTYAPLSVVSTGPRDGGGSDAWLELEFTTPVPSRSVAEHLTLSPVPDGWDPPSQSWAWTRWTYGLQLAPQTTYAATLSAGVEDQFGQRTTEPTTWTFRTGDRDPTWAVPSGVSLYPANNPPVLPFRHVNLQRLTVRAGAVTPDAVRSVYGDLEVAGSDWMVPVTAPRNTSQGDVVPLQPYLSPEGYGWVATRFTSPDFGTERPIQRDGVLVVTDLGATVKLEPGATEVFVTSLATGEPVPDVAVSLRFAGRSEGEGEVPMVVTPLGATDAKGWLRFEGAPARDWRSYESEVAVLLEKGADRSVVFGEWTPTWGWFQNDGSEVRTHGFADRGLYRLGDPVHAHVSLRRADARGLSGVAGSAKWTLHEPGGADVAVGTAPVVGDGVVDVTTALPASGSLGDWSLEVETHGEGWSATTYVPVPVKAYRPAAFRVETDGPRALTAGEELTVTADARYLFGAPMNDAAVVFRAWARLQDFSPEGFEAWDFGPEATWWTADAVDEPAPALADARPKLVDGAATYTVRLDDPRFADEAFVVAVEAVVTDVDQQSLASSREVTVLPAAYGLGLKPTSWVATVGEPATVEVVAVAGDASPVGDRPVELQVVRRSFDTVRERALDGRWRYVTTTTDAPVTTGSVRTGSGPVRFSFTPAEAGLHVFVARSTDAAGKVTTSESSVYVAGGDASWARDEGRAWLVPDQREYHAGDTARVVVKGHVPGSWALVTVEREGVVWREARQLVGSSPVVEIPLSPEWIPGVRVSVAAVTGAGPQDAPDKGRPELVFGTVELPIDASDRHLAVAVTAPTESLRPRDQVDVSIAVTRGGEPARNTSVTLFAVDEAVLSLTGYSTPDAFEEMYRAHAQNVITLDNRQAVLDRAKFLTKGASPGGGGGMGEGSGPELRSKFVTTITWQSLQTGPDGTVKASFELPDNLTEFRVMAVAEQADAFGAGHEAIHVSRPLVLRAALPRVLREGDDAFAGVVVHNHTDEAHNVTVEASVEGAAELVSGSPAVIRVEAGGAAQVPFHLRGLEAGTATLRFRGEMAGEQDGLEVPLRVQRDVFLESVGTTALVDGTWTERLALPDGARPGVGGLRVSLGTTALAGTDDALEYLLDYPYGCVEQITSRGMGALALLSVRERSGSALPEARLTEVVQSVIDRLPRYASGEGGWSYWPGAFERPSIDGTRYVVEFLSAARKAGFTVPMAELSDGATWLRQTEGRWEFRQLSPEAQRRVRAEVAFALVAAGEADQGMLSLVYADREQLSLQHRAELLSALLLSAGPDGRTTELARSLESKLYVEAGGASVRDPAAARWWGSDDRSTAATLEAFVLAGDSPFTPKLALHLANSRRSGRWHDTRATAAALRALAAYALRHETQGTSVEAVITLAGQELVRDQLPVPGARTVDVAMADLASGPLVATGQRVYFASRLTYAPLVPQPREEGLWLDRRLELVDGGGPNGELVAGATVRVTLTLATPAERFDVAVRDPFPAGLEVVDTSLATASRFDAGLEDGEPAGPSDGWDEFGGRSFDHVELDDGEVRLFASSLTPGVHTYRYLLRATTPGRFAHPPARAEEMYEPENFGSTAGGAIVVAP
jgi:uncharacterized protein YfaS (alpha-2-macroglobulin family)